MARLLKRSLAVSGWLLLGAILGQLLFHVVISGGGTALAPWHLAGPEGELTATGAYEVEGLKGYLALEESLFKETDLWLRREVGDFPVMSRFDPSSPTHSASFERDWNRTFVLTASQPRGGAVLLHGLSDSPYSVRTLGDQLNAAGYHVVGLRLPGHGTIPGALDSVAWEDWRAAVRIAVAEVSARIGEGRPLVVAGYSNGAALALDYTLSSIDESSLRVPSHVIMMSPAIAVTPLAVLARYQRLLGMIPGLETLRWSSITPEYDPFKYNSFPMRAASEIYRLTSTLESRLAKLDAEGRTTEIPPMFIVQSIVDATVPPLLSLPRIVDRLNGTGSELVLYDVNRLSSSEAFLKPGTDAILRQETADRTRGISVTLVTNTSAESLQVEARTREAGQTSWTTNPIDLEWPPSVYSLAHVAIPFPPDDPVYGSVPRGRDPFPFGILDARGEKGALIVPQSLLMRLRYNPFYDYQAARIARFLDLGP